MNNNAVCAVIDKWLTSWDSDPLGGKGAFEAYYDYLKNLPEVFLEFHKRPSISFSLRARHKAQAEDSLFVLIDVVDDEPEARWLSICFFANMVKDPEGLGDLVPQGLMDSDALCLNLEDADAEMEAYILQRIYEAHDKASV